jgi:hypothetical protein
MADEHTKRPWLPPRWFVRLAWYTHRGLYRLSGGRFGLRKEQDDKWGMMRLTTTGRRSGQERSVILAYLEDGSTPPMCATDTRRAVATVGALASGRREARRLCRAPIRGDRRRGARTAVVVSR